MDLTVQKNAIKLISRISDHRTATKPVIPYYPQKGKIAECTAVKKTFERVSPESQGINSNYIRRFIETLAADKSLDMHSITILRHGKIISETYFGAYRRGIPHATYSMAKTVVGIAVGMAIDEGLLTLDTKTTDVFGQQKGFLNSIIKKNITVRNLITMSSGSNFNEVGCVTETDWVKGFNESVIKYEPGHKFDYNSMNTYMLSAMLTALTGVPLDEYLKPRLFEPLGIENYMWEKSPTNIIKGGWGLYILPEDIAKIGVMLLDDGVFDGVRIVSEQWVNEMTKRQIAATDGLGDYDYGYHVWVGRNSHSFLMNGMFGQNVACYKDNDIVIVSNAGNNEFFQQSNYFKALSKFFDNCKLSETPLPRSRRELKKLRITEKCQSDKFFRGRICLIEHYRQKKLYKNVVGRYEFDKHRSDVGIMPILTQILQNNFSEGLTEITVDSESIVFTEGNESYRLSVTLGKTTETDLVFHGEPYHVVTYCEATTDEDGRTVIKLKLSFIETANTRFIKLRFNGDEIIAELDEQPSKQYISAAAGQLMSSLPARRTLDPLYRKLDDEFLAYKIDDTLKPELHGLKK